MAEAPGPGLLRGLKATAGRGPAWALPVGSPPRWFLRPVATSPDRLDTGDVRRLTEWRNRYVTAFLTEFRATPERTASWLTDVVGPAGDKLLLMAEDATGRTFGYLGLAFIDWSTGHVEADAIVRGEPADPGAMTACLRALLRWARQGLGLPDVWVRVRSDNRALAFYRTLGFVDRRVVPLRREEEPGLVRWVEDPSLTEAEVSLVHLQLPEEAKCAS